MESRDIDHTAYLDTVLLCPSWEATMGKLGHAPRRMFCVGQWFCCAIRATEQEE